MDSKTNEMSGGLCPAFPSKRGKKKIGSTERPPLIESVVYKSTHIKAHSTNILDYHSNLSMYEKDSLASEARLAAERKAKKLLTSNCIPEASPDGSFDK
ncbi:MAG: hypothetical protein ACYDDS_07840 [Candidatus Sulfotelmatobacter sp.]